MMTTMMLERTEEKDLEWAHTVAVELFFVFFSSDHSMGWQEKEVRGFSWLLATSQSGNNKGKSVGVGNWVERDGF